VSVRHRTTNSIRVSPKIAAVIVGFIIAFKAIIYTAPWATFTWSVAEGGAAGRVTADGVYTTPVAASTYHVVATRADKPTQYATATVTGTRPVPAPRPKPTPTPKPSPAPTPTPAPAPAPAPTPISWTAITADMGAPNEAQIGAVPLYWGMQQGAVQVAGKNVPSYGGALYTHTNSWGVANIALGGSTATNTRINIRRMEYWIRTGSTWKRIEQTDTPPGAAYWADFHDGGANIAGNTRIEPDGTLSFKVLSGRNYHFYPQPRTPIPDPSNVQGNLIVVQARLIKDNPAGVDDTASARYILNVGGDYWPSAAMTLAQMQSAGYPATDIGGSKFKYVKPYWRFHAYTSLTAAQLQANPPPINLDGGSP
jgi:hypothetical protein